MKYVFVLFFLFFGNFVKGQSVLPHDAAGKITFSETIKVDSSEADELYRRAKTWVFENFINVRQIVQKDDVINHVIVLRGAGECYSPKSFGDTIENANNSYTLEIAIENEGYKYTMSDFKTTDKWKGDLPSESVKGSKKQLQLHEQLIQELAATLTKSLKLSMASKIVVGNE